MLIVFEGTEGAGKTTQIARLAEYFRQKGRVVRLLREPGGTPVGEEIRHIVKQLRQHPIDPITELLLINAARAELVRTIILPARAAGDVVICDRFYFSTIAYQGYGRQLGQDINPVIAIAIGKCQPDLTLLLRISLETSKLRRQLRGEPLDHFDSSGDEFFRRVESGYDKISSSYDRMYTIDAEREVDQVTEEVIRVVEARLS